MLKATAALKAIGRMKIYVIINSLIEIYRSEGLNKRASERRAIEKIIADRELGEQHDSFKRVYFTNAKFLLLMATKLGSLAFFAQDPWINHGQPLMNRQLEKTFDAIDLDEPEYEIEDILEMREDNEHRQFLVKWKVLIPILSK